MPDEPRKDTVNRLGQPQNVREAVESHRSTHGRGTSRWLAQQYGVSQRTAQRWLAGSQSPRPSRASQVIDGADSDRVRVNALRQTQRADFGRVRIRERSPNRVGYRQLGDMAVNFDAVADALEAGASEEEAQAIYDDCVLRAYGNGTDRALEILGYENDPTYQ